MSWVGPVFKDPATRKAERAAKFDTPEAKAFFTRMEEEERQVAAALAAQAEMEAIDMDDFVAEAEVTVAEMEKEFPEVDPDDVAHDIVINLQLQLDQPRRQEFRQRMGFYIDEEGW